VARHSVFSGPQKQHSENIFISETLSKSHMIAPRIISIFITKHSPPINAAFSRWLPSQITSLSTLDEYPNILTDISGRPLTFSGTR